MTSVEDSVPISAVERYAFCPRQAYLFHRERLHADNRYTLEGSRIHRRVTEGNSTQRGTVRMLRSLQIASVRLGVHGVADVVELYPEGPVPVEYKRGGKKVGFPERAQLCLQALCLEEIFQTTIPSGFLYSDAQRRRVEVPFDEALRQATEGAVASLKAALQADRAPPAILEPHCARCSLQEMCLPTVTRGGRSARRWLAAALEGGS